MQNNILIEYVENYIKQINWNDPEIKKIMLKADLNNIIKIIDMDPSISIGKMRTICEKISKYIYEKTEENTYLKKKFADILYNLFKNNQIEKPIYLFFNTIRIAGNIGIHAKIENKKDILSLIPMFTSILEWFIERILPSLKLKNFIEEIIKENEREKEKEFSGFNILKKGFCAKSRDNEYFMPLTFLSTSQYNPELKCEETKPHSSSWDNPLETEIISKLIVHLYDEFKEKGIDGLWSDNSIEAKEFREKKNQKKPIKIGIITFYDRHFKMISKQLHSLTVLKRKSKVFHRREFEFKDLPIVIELGKAESYKDKVDIMIIPLTRTNTTRSIEGILEYKDIVYSTLKLYKNNLFIIGDWDFYKDLKIDKEKTEENNPFMILCDYLKINMLIAFLRINDEKINSEVRDRKETKYPQSEVRELSIIKYKKDLKKRRK